MTRRCLRVSKLSYVEQLPANYFGVFMPAIEVFIGALLCDFGRLPHISPWMALIDPPANLTCTVHTIFLGHDASRRVCKKHMHVCLYVCMYVTGNAWIETNERACWALQDRKSILNTFIKCLEFLASFKTDKKRNELPEKRRWRSLLGMYNLREIKHDPLQDDNKIIYENHNNNFISVCLSGSKSSAPQNILTSCRHIYIDAYIYIYSIHIHIHMCV